MSMSTHAQVTKPTSAQAEHLSAWTTLALLKMPYFVSILYSMRFLDAPGLGTFAVDKDWRCYIDFEAVTAKGPQWCADSLLHEACHLWMDHAGQSTFFSVAPEERGIWNYAADFSINDDLVQAGCVTLSDMLPGVAGLPENRTAGEYLYELRKKMPPQQAQGTSGNKSGPDQGDQDSQDGQSSGDQSDQDGQGSGADSQPFSGCGSGSGGNPWEGELPSSQDLDGAAAPVPDSQKEQAKIGVAIALQEHAKTRGTAPGGFSDFAGAVLAPSPVPWEQVLAANVRRASALSAGRTDVSYVRRNRRFLNRELTDSKGGIRGRMILPGPVAPVPSIHLVRDTSGSMSTEDLGVVSREVAAISKRLGITGRQLLVTDVDAVVHTTVGFTGEASIHEVSGRGGTDMRVGIEHAVESRPRPDVVVVATDGETPWPAVNAGVPVVACLVVRSRADGERLAQSVPDWIRTVIVTPEAR